MEATEPYFAVGEYWDSLSYTYGEMDHNQDAHRQRIIDWINAASGTAGAFDVTTKGILHSVSISILHVQTTEDTTQFHVLQIEKLISQFYFSISKVFLLTIVVSEVHVLHFTVFPTVLIGYETVTYNVRLNDS